MSRHPQGISKTTLCLVSFLVLVLFGCGRFGFEEDPCKDVLCSGHGTCSVEDGVATCLCDAEYVNEGPTECIPDPALGECVTNSDCDDANACTTDVCSAEGVCRHDMHTGPCDDGLYCTDGDACDGRGHCVGGGLRDCSSVDEACRVGVCNESTDRCEGQPVLDGDECGARFCNGLDWMRGTCLAGECSSTERVTACADGNACTVDQCDAAGCSNLPVPDGDECGARFCNG
ncbi:MAG: hypothetical protein JRF33_10240, partial [Deltaproteobacteria bacterium]|nr:hypothetical protein [Deltaproteobacteria bacterium]